MLHIVGSSGGGGGEKTGWGDTWGGDKELGALGWGWGTRVHVCLG